MIAAELVWNACKHAFPGRRRGSIVVTAASEGRHLVLSVGDDGIGSVARPARGAGTGLAMVKKIAAQHGGRVKVETAAGAGTCVSVAFALPPSKAGVGAGAARPPRRPSRPPDVTPEGASGQEAMV